MRVTSLLSSLVLSSTIAGAAMLPRELDVNSIILLGKDGRTEVMDKDEYWALHKHETKGAGPLIVNGTSDAKASRSLSKRGCKSYSIVVPNEDQVFLNWDVPMSSVVKAGAANSTVAVTPGYTIADAIGSSVGASLQIPKWWVSFTASITYTKTWTSTYTAAYTYPVPAGLYGVVVSNPKTLRKSGSVVEGCIGPDMDVSTFQGDSYSSQSYGSLSWVEGTISLCTGTTYPVPMCIGQGTLS